MSDRLPPGPYRTVAMPGGAGVPFYVVPYDEHGICSGPLTRDHLLRAAPGFSDVFLFSHGWNNDWSAAVDRYEDFLAGYQGMRVEQALPARPGYKPLLVGVFWPSTALVFGEDERGPQIAASEITTPEAVDAAVGEERAELQALATGLDPRQAEELYLLVQRDELDEAQALRLAELLRRGYTTGSGEEPTPAPSAADLVASWVALAKVEAELSGEEEDLEDFGTVGDGASPLRAAGLGGLLGKLDPRKIVRALTVWQMKNRAGTVGSNGVHDLLRALLRDTDARIHLIGHSFGAKVVLSAAAAGPAHRRKIESMLLLQPAVSHLCFAGQLPGGGAGGYHHVPGRVAQPILTTFSAHDFPLTRTFHLALRRDGDLGEARIAAAPRFAQVGEPPSKYAALGGYGPRGAGEKLIEIQKAGAKYELDPGVRVYGLHGTSSISGHGDVSNESTWWALHHLAR